MWKYNNGDMPFFWFLSLDLGSAFVDEIAKTAFLGGALDDVVG